MPDIRVVCWNVNNFKGSTFTKHGNTILSKIYNPAGVRQIDVFVVVEPYSKMKKFGLASLVTEGAGIDGVLALYFALVKKDIRWKVVPLRTTATPPVSDMIALYYHSGVVDMLGPDELGGVGPLVTKTATPLGHALPWNMASDRWGQVRFYKANGTEVNFHGRRPTLFHVAAPDRQSKTFTVDVVAPGAAVNPSVVTNVLPNGAQGVPYEVLLQADGGTPGYTWAQAVPTSLPAGVAFAALTGTLQGTPTTSGPFSLKVTLTDSGAKTVTKTLAFTIAAANAALAIETAGALPDALQNVPYRVRIAGQGGRGARRMTHARTKLGDALPPGLTLSADGLVSGTPSTVATPSFDVDLTADAAMSRDFAMDVVAPGGGLAVFTNALPNGAVGMPYEFRLQPEGGSAPYTWASNVGTLLATGLIFDTATGTLRGQPTAAGACTLNVTLTDNTAATTTAVLNFAIAAAGTELGFAAAATLPRALQNAPYRMHLASIGGHGTRATLQAADLPDGLSLTPDSVARTFSMDVVAPGGGGLAVFTNALPDGAMGVPYEFLLQPKGGTLPYTWTQNMGTTLVAGLVFSTATGTLHGTPTAAGACTLDVTLGDGAASSVNVALNFTVVAAAVALDLVTNATLPRALLNAPYRMRLASRGGYGERTIELSGSLAKGLSVTVDGLISGTPTKAVVGHTTATTLFDSSGVISGTPTTAVVAHSTPIQLLDGGRTFKLVALHAPPQARYPKNRDSVKQLANMREINALRCGISVAVCGDFNCCTHPLLNCGGSHKAGEAEAFDPLIENGYDSRNNNARSGCKSAGSACKAVYAWMKTLPNDARLDDLCTHSFDHILTIGFSAVTNVETVNLVREDSGYGAAKTQAQAAKPSPIKGIVKKYLWSSGVSDHLPIRFTLTM